MKTFYSFYLTLLLVATGVMSCQKDDQAPKESPLLDEAWVSGVIECNGSAGGDSAIALVGGLVVDSQISTTPGGLFKLSVPPNTAVSIRISNISRQKTFNITTGQIGSIYDLGFIRLCGSASGLDISAGNGNSLFIKPDGTLWSCGSNNEWGQLGLGLPLFTPSLAPDQIGTDNNWYKVAAGNLNGYAIKTDGNSYAFGKGEFCGLGIFSTNPSTPVLNGVNVASVSSGPSDNCWLIKKGSGQLQAFGDINTYTPPSGVSNALVLFPTTIGTLIPGRWKQVLQDGGGAYALKEDGTLWHTITGVDSLLSQVGTDTWTEIAAGAAIRSDGTLWTLVGSNWIQIPNTGNSWIKISSWPGGHRMAIKSDGSLWGWGDNSYGQIGDGTTINRTTPVRIGMDSNWDNVSAGAAHTIATKNNGSVWTWGQNGGALGTGDTQDRLTPFQIYF